MTNLGKRAALSNGNLISNSHVTESRGDVSREVAVALLKTVVLGNVVEVVAANDASTSKSQQKEEP